MQKKIVFLSLLCATLLVLWTACQQTPKSVKIAAPDVQIQVLDSTRVQVQYGEDTGNADIEARQNGEVLRKDEAKNQKNAVTFLLQPQKNKESDIVWVAASGKNTGISKILPAGIAVKNIEVKNGKTYIALDAVAPAEAQKTEVAVLVGGKKIAAQLSENGVVEISEILPEKQNIELQYIAAAANANQDTVVTKISYIARMPSCEDVVYGCASGDLNHLDNALRGTCAYINLNGGSCDNLTKTYLRTDLKTIWDNVKNDPAYNCCQKLQQLRTAPEKPSCTANCSSQ